MLVFMFSLLDSNRIFLFRKNNFLIEMIQNALKMMTKSSTYMNELLKGPKKMVPLIENSTYRGFHLSE